MEMLAFVKCFPTASLLRAVPPAISLSFNPIKLVLLIGWVYLCLYSVQYVQFSSLVPEHRKSIANVAVLFAGPIVLFVLLIMDVRRKSLENGEGIFAVIKERLQDVGESIRSSKLAGGKDATIQLFDSSGRSIKEIYGHGESGRKDRHVLDLTEEIISGALEERATDILIDPKDDLNYRIRFRIDGMLSVVDEFEANTCQAIINSIKAVSNMDIAEKRRPQDGAFTAKMAEATASFRVASAGAVNGEKLSIRILNPNIGVFTLASIGLSYKQRQVIEDEVAKPNGMVLISGPTGSGKTITLYAMLEEIDFFTRNVVTVEDPIERILPNASQIEVNPKADITFAKSLRSILRHDPDVIVIGEMIDPDTISTALRAAETGYLILGVLYASDANQAVGHIIEAFTQDRQQQVRVQLSRVLEAVLSQRLAIRINGGRVAAFEVMIADDTVKELIREAKAIQFGDNGSLQGMDQALARLVEGGIISADEAMSKSNNPEQLREILQSKTGKVKVNK